MPGEEAGRGLGRLKSCTSLKAVSKVSFQVGKERTNTPGDVYSREDGPRVRPQECRAQDPVIRGEIRETTRERIDIATAVKFT